MTAADLKGRPYGLLFIHAQGGMELVEWSESVMAARKRAEDAVLDKGDEIVLIQRLALRVIPPPPGPQWMYPDGETE